MSQELHCGKYRLPLSRPLIMGIVNCTPDSFSGDGVALDLDRAVEQARQFLADGADILDIGGESSRPGAEPVAEDEELRRVIPAIEALAGCGAPLSIDTMKPAVMREALRAGASFINDIYALRSPGALELAANSGAGVCLMHMRGVPRSMQEAPLYGNVVKEVGEFLSERCRAAQAGGIARDHIVVDPGFGFGKTAEHNLLLLQGLPRLVDLGYPVLVGLSRKSLLGALTGRRVTERLAASIAAALASVAKGAGILRVHDVAATRDALAVWQAAAG